MKALAARRVMRVSDRSVPDAVRTGCDATGRCMDSPEDQSSVRRLVCPDGASGERAHPRFGERTQSAIR